MSMIFANFTPWQLLLWVAALLMITLPLFTMLVSACISAYYAAKEKHTKTMVKYLVDCLDVATKAAADMVTKKAEELKSRGENK